MRLTRLVLVVALGLLSASCGVRAQERPERLGKSAGIVLPDTVPSDAGAVPTAGEVFFVRDQRLVAVARSVAPADVEAAVRVLLEGPTDAEAAGGLRSAVPVGTRLRSAAVEGGTATVDLSGSFADVSGENQVPAVAQLVFTATGVVGVERVTVAVDGTVIDVPRSDGTLTPAPLTRDDFVTLAPV